MSCGWEGGEGRGGEGVMVSYWMRLCVTLFELASWFISFWAANIFCAS